MKNKKHTSIPLTALLLCLCFLLFSFTEKLTDNQAIKEKLKKVNDTYTSMNNFSMNVTYNLYPTYKSTVPSDIYKGYYKKVKTNIHSHLLGIETIQSEKIRIVIDSSDKLMLLANPVLTSKVALVSFNLDSALALCSRVELKQDQADEDVFKLLFDDEESEFSSILICIDKKQNLIKKLTLFYNTAVPLNNEDENSAKEKPRVDIIYSDVNTKATAAKNEFSESNYFSMLKGKYVPAKQYEKYKIINQKL